MKVRDFLKDPGFDIYRISIFKITHMYYIVYMYFLVQNISNFIWTMVWFMNLYFYTWEIYVPCVCVVYGVISLYMAYVRLELHHS